MQEEGIFSRVATGATDRGSGRVLGHGVAAGLGCGMKKPVAGCYGRLTRWKGGGDVVYMALL